LIASPPNLTRAAGVPVWVPWGLGAACWFALSYLPAAF